MATDEAQRRRARETYREVNGFDAMEPSDFFLELTVDHVFGELWTRPTLTRRERRLITLAAIATAGAATALDVHVRSALESGDVTPDEMTEIAAHLAHYAGFPLATGLYTAFRRVAGELERAEAAEEAGTR